MIAAILLIAKLLGLVALVIFLGTFQKAVRAMKHNRSFESTAEYDAIVSELTETLIVVVLVVVLMTVIK